MTPPHPETVSDFRLLLTGPVGSGKSSFINSISSVFAGRIKQPAVTGNSPTGITRKVRNSSFSLNTSCINYTRATFLQEHVLH